MDDTELWATLAFDATDDETKEKGNACVHCGLSDALDLEDGNVVCRACDTVNTRHLDSTAEWRCFGGGDTDMRSRDMKRCSGMLSSSGNAATEAYSGQHGGERCGAEASSAADPMGSSIVVSTCGGGRGGGKGGRSRKRRPARVPEDVREKEEGEEDEGGRRVHDGSVSPSSAAAPSPSRSSKDAGSLVVTRMMQRVHFWNSMTHRERSLMGVFETLRVQAANHGIPRCILEEAKQWFKNVSEGRIMRGENRNAVIACSIFVACKANDVPRSVREIASIFNVRPVAMTKAFNAYVGARDVAVTHSRPSHFVARFCCRLELATETTQLCMRIVTRAEEGSLLEENTPPTVVSGAILMACVLTGEIHVTKDRIAEVTQTRPTTVSKSYKRLLLHKDELLR